MLALASLLAADVAPAAEGKRNWGGQLSIEEGYTDNVRADAVRIDDAFYTTLEGQGWWRRAKKGWLPHYLGASVRGRVYSGFSNRDFAEFGPSLGYTWKLATLSMDYRFSPETLRVDPEATADGFAEVHDLSTELRSRFGAGRRWTATLNLDSEWEEFEPAFRGRSYFEETIKAGLRYRATRVIMPRASVAYSIRDATSQNFDREEVALLFGVDFFLPAGVRALVRYEKTWRNFIVGFEQDPEGGKNTNFGREDDEDQFEAGLDVPMPYLESVKLRLRYRYRDNHSTRESRTFDVNEASVKLTYDF